MENQILNHEVDSNFTLSEDSISVEYVESQEKDALRSTQVSKIEGEQNAQNAQNYQKN